MPAGCSFSRSVVQAAVAVLGLLILLRIRGGPEIARGVTFNSAGESAKVSDSVSDVAARALDPVGAAPHPEEAREVSLAVAPSQRVKVEEKASVGSLETQRAPTSKHPRVYSSANAQALSPVSDFDTKPFDFPISALEHPSMHFGEESAARRAEAKIRTGQVVKIVVFGGSVTAGRRCGNQPFRERSCAWPARLRNWFTAHFKNDSNIAIPEVHNFGSGGSRTASSLPVIAMRIRSIQPDIVIWDFGMNDCSAFARKSLRELAKLDDHGPIEPEAVERAFKQDAKDPAFLKEVSILENETATVTEVFARLVLQIIPWAMIIMFFVGPPRAWSPEVGWSIHDCQRVSLPVAAHYGISVVSYFDLTDHYDRDYKERGGFKRAANPGKLWTLPKTVQIPIIAKGKWQDHRHCTWHTHVYMAYVLAAFLQGIGVISKVGDRRSLPLPMPPTPPPLPPRLAPAHVLAKWPVCVEPLATYIAEEAFKDGSAAGAAGKGWDLIEDVPGKPGWISTEFGSTISFPVSFGAKPALALTFLSSYEGLGEVFVQLLGNKNHYKISGIWNDKTSQATTVFFRPAEPWHVGIQYAAAEEAFTGDGLGGFGVQPNSKHELRLTLVSAKKKTWQKFKLLSVFSC